MTRASKINKNGLCKLLCNTASAMASAHIKVIIIVVCFTLRLDFLTQDPNICYLPIIILTRNKYCHSMLPSAVDVFECCWDQPRGQWRPHIKSIPWGAHRQSSLSWFPSLHMAWTRFKYSWIGRPVRTHTKSICRETKRATTDLNIRMKSSWRGASIGGTQRNNY